MKKFLILIVAVFFSQAVFAKANIRLEASAGPMFSITEPSDDAMMIQLLGLGFNYEFKLSDRNFLTVGADLCMPLPYAGLELAYVHCLQNSQSNYKFYFEPSIKAGTLILPPQDYTYEDENGNLQIGYSNYVFSPLVQVNAMFSLKPENHGFFFALGPQLSIYFQTSQTGFEEVMLIPGITVNVGYHF